MSSKLVEVAVKELTLSYQNQKPCYLLHIHIMVTYIEFLSSNPVVGRCWTKLLNFVYVFALKVAGGVGSWGF